VAVGGSYFPDGIGGKPWVDGSALKAKQFWDVSICALTVRWPDF